MGWRARAAHLHPADALEEPGVADPDPVAPLVGRRADEVLCELRQRTHGVQHAIQAGGVRLPQLAELRVHLDHEAVARQAAEGAGHGRGRASDVGAGQLSPPRRRRPPSTRFLSLPSGAQSSSRIFLSATRIVICFFPNVLE